MPCNLIPPPLLPVRAHSLPRILLAACLSLCGVWIVHQTATAAASRRRQARCLSELDSLADQLRVARERDAQFALAQTRRQALRRQAAFVTLLTRQAPPLAHLLQAIAEATPPNLRLTRVSFGPDDHAEHRTGAEEHRAAGEGGKQAQEIGGSSLPSPAPSPRLPALPSSP